MKKSLRELLRCPYCGGRFKFSASDDGTTDSSYGLLSCHCDEYPVVSGIPIIKKGQIGANKQSVKKITSLIHKGRHQDALISMSLSTPQSPTLAPDWLNRITSMTRISIPADWTHRSRLAQWRDNVSSLLDNRKGNTTARDLFDLYFKRSNRNRSSAYNYFTYRFGQPRHLVALSLGELIDKPSKPILDLGCGFGHIARDLVPKSNGQPVIGVDNNFYTLYVSKYWVAPEAEYIFCDGDLALPFNDNAFSNLMCINSFHTFTNKLTCIRESRRVTDPDGVIVLAGLRHTGYQALTDNPVLPIEEYKALLTDMPNTLISDNEVLLRYLQKKGPRLDSEEDMRVLKNEPFVTLVASHNRSAFRDYGKFESWPHAKGPLYLNPLYVREGSDDQHNLHLKLQFPSEEYEEENKECKQYLPQKVTINNDLLREIDRDRQHPDVDALVSKCVLLGLPERYF